MSLHGSLVFKDNHPDIFDNFQTAAASISNIHSIGSETDQDILQKILSRSVGANNADTIADKLMMRFGDFGAILAASNEKLVSEGGISPEVARDLKLIETAAGRLAQTRITGREVISSWDALIAYCRIKMAYREVEQFRVLFLDRKNHLIIDELLQSGTVDHVPVYPREVAKRALEVNASALILVHNHPSGDATPSQSDIEMTQRVAAALDMLDIQLHDHVIISREADYSFRSQGKL